MRCGSDGVPYEREGQCGSLMAEIKLLTCRIGSGDLSDSILRRANLNDETSCLCAEEPKCRTL